MCQEREFPFDEQLQQLAQNAQQHPPRTSEKQLALTLLISEIQDGGNLYCIECLSDGYSLPPNVAQDSYQQTREKLWLFIHRPIDKFNTSNSNIILWVNQHFEEIFNEKVSQPFNHQLRKLALEAQWHPPKTRGRQLALDRLIREIQASPEFYRPPSRGFSARVYHHLYQEALQELWLSICRGGIDNYDPQQGRVIAWINEHFRWRFRDAVTAARQRNETVDLDPETVMQTTETPSLTDQLRSLILEDPDGLFRQAHITDHPEANFRDLLLRWLDGQSWEEMAAELGIKSVTLRVFYHRQLRRFAQILREYLEE